MTYSIFAKKDDEQANILKNKIKQLIKLPYNEKTPKILICIGGDGTILSAIQRYQKQIDDLIIFGINAGHLGFYTNYKFDEYMNVVNAINNEKYFVEENNLLYYDAKGPICLKGIALNELTIMSPHRTLVLDIHIDDVKFSTYRGTGLLICTSTGSTAYNKSINGAVVHPNIKAIQLNEIAPINSNVYKTLSSPLILDDKTSITFKNIKSDICLTADTNYYESMIFDEVVIGMYNKTIKMAYTDHKSFISRLKYSFLKD